MVPAISQVRRTDESAQVNLIIYSTSHSMGQLMCTGTWQLDNITALLPLPRCQCDQTGALRLG